MGSGVKASVLRVRRLMTLKRMRQSQKHALCEYYMHTNNTGEHNSDLQRNMNAKYVRWENRRSCLFGCESCNFSCIGLNWIDEVTKS